jgi:CPA2 family monovalent cation:H+ antiporter-2
MEAAGVSLQPVLVLLACAVFAVVGFRSLHLPPMLGYLLTGVVLGPYALGLIPDTSETRHLAEFGIVFLMFSIGLEFSLPKLMAMRKVVFGLGLAQVVATLAVGFALGVSLGASWQASLIFGGAIAMSSTAIVSKLLAERLELDTPHGREIIGVLLFQDLAVVPLLIVIPALGRPPGEIGVAVGIALVKAAIVLGALILVGPHVMRFWFNIVARRRSTELFVLNVLFITLGLAYLTSLAGLSLALGAFLAGMLISETQFRYQVEEDIRPFRDILLGLFFVTVGMMLDLPAVAARWLAVAIAVFLIVAAKFGLITLLARAFGGTQGTALRTALALAQAGEFGFVLLANAGEAGFVSPGMAQVLLAAMIISMLASPFIIAASDSIVIRFSASEWMLRSLELHRIAVQSIGSDRHVVILGYGRNGQRLARLLDAEGIRYVALDLDPERVREAALAGDTVVYADCSRREALTAAGLARAAAVVITFANADASVRVLSNIHALNPAIPVIVRAREESEIERLHAAGASEVVPEALESGLMLASHTLVWIGVPLSRVMRRLRLVRDEHYGLMRGLFHGASDEGAPGDSAQPRLHSITVVASAYAVGKRMSELKIESTGVQVKAVRRSGQGNLVPSADLSIEANDVVVLLGAPESLSNAEVRLLQG